MVVRCADVGRALAVVLCAIVACGSGCSGSIGGTASEGWMRQGGSSGLGGSRGGTDATQDGGGGAGGGGGGLGVPSNNAGQGGGAGAPGASAGVCSQFESGQQVGTLFDGPTETSGIVASRKQDDVLWVHEDAGATPVLYAVSKTGAVLGQWRIQTDFRIYDWEDLALESMAGRADRIWIGDIGDNGVRDGEAPRTSIHIARVAEPAVDRTVAPTTMGRLTAEDSFTFTYPDTPHDAEAIAVDPQSGDLYIFAKVGTTPAGVFRARAPLASGVLELVATIEAASLNAADFSPTGDELLVRDYATAFYFARGAGTWPEALTAKPKKIRLQSEAAAEAIGFAGNGSGFFTISEGANSPIWFYAKTCI